MPYKCISDQNNHKKEHVGLVTWTCYISASNPKENCNGYYSEISGHMESSSLKICH